MYPVLFFDGIAVNARARSIATPDRIGRRTGCSRSFEGGGLKQQCLRENTPSTSARMDRRRPVRIAETSFGKVGEPLRHWMEVVVRSGSENAIRDCLQSGIQRCREVAGRGSPLRGCGYRSAAVSAETRSRVLGVPGRALSGGLFPELRSNARICRNRNSVLSPESSSGLL